VVADEHGGSAAFWTVSISAILAALSGILIRDSGPAEENVSDAARATEG
jgi:hypothetical protein